MYITTYYNDGMNETSEIPKAVESVTIKLKNVEPPQGLPNNQNDRVDVWKVLIQTTQPFVEETIKISGAMTSIVIKNRDGEV